MTRRLRLLLFSPVAILGIALFAFLGGEIILRLWNWLIPPLFGWHAVTFWQALGLLALCRILFGRWGGNGFSRDRARRRIRERLDRMTPEERERFQTGWRGRCGFGPPASE
jgi:hypothetical protein